MVDIVMGNPEIITDGSEGQARIERLAIAHQQRYTAEAPVTIKFEADMAEPPDRRGQGWEGRQRILSGEQTAPIACDSHPPPGTVVRALAVDLERPWTE